MFIFVPVFHGIAWFIWCLWCRHALRGRDIHTAWRRTGKLYTPISCNRFIRERRSLQL